MSTPTFQSHDSTDSAIQLSDHVGTKNTTPSTSFGAPLQVEFTWKKFRAILSAKDDPSHAPLYDVNCRFTSPHYIFDSPARNTSIGIGNLHAVNTKATCTVHGNDILLQPLKRLETKYNYLSYAFKRADGSRAVLIWEGTLRFKTWDFVLLDEQQLPIARFKANVWGVHDMGSLEFMHPETITEAMRDEIVVTGTMVYQQMVLRTGNFLNLIGAGFSKTGPVRDEKAE